MQQYREDILRFLRDIFFDEVYTPQKTSSPKDLTEYYKKQLWNLYLDSVIVAKSYVEVENIIDAYKYRSERDRGFEMSAYMSDILDSPIYMSKFGEDMSKFTIVPVPMHWTRYAFRGFDHMSKLAKILSTQRGLSYSYCLRAWFSWRQSRLSREKRLENRRNRFTMNPRCTVPENVILIDDVISTGSTANECAKVLKEMWAKKVIGIFFASSAS